MRGEKCEIAVYLLLGLSVYLKLYVIAKVGGLGHNARNNYMIEFGTILGQLI